MLNPISDAGLGRRWTAVQGCKADELKAQSAAAAGYAFGSPALRYR